MEQIPIDWDQLKPAIISKEKTREVTDAAVERAALLISDEREVEMLDAIAQVAGTSKFFISDDIWVILGEPRDKYDGSALGPVMRQAAKMGIVRKTNTTQKSGRPITHGKHLPVWESLVYRG